MYSKHFGFEALPFCVTPDPRFFYSTEIYQDVLAGLEHGIDAKSAFIVVTGEVGTGKTTLLRRLIYCSADTVDYAFINVHSQLSCPAILRAILKDLRVPSASTDQQCLLEELGKHVLDRFTKGRSIALLFDEAQDLSDEILLELPVIWNLAIESEKLIPIVLMGQPELDTRFKSSKLRQLGQHITLWRRLAPFSDDDVGPYIATRLELVGYRGDELFEPAAIERLISRSNGIPRLINNICDNALLRAYRTSQHKVTAAMIDEIANQLRLAERPIRPKPKNIEVADQWPFVKLLRTAGENKIAPSGGRPRFGDLAASADSMEIDEGAKETAFAGRTPTASKKKTEVVANQPSRHREILPEENQSQGDEHSVMDAIEASRARDEIAPSLRDLAVDQQPFLDRLASPTQKSAPGINGLETALPGGLPTPSNSMNGPLREPSLFEPKRVGWLNERLNNVNRLTLSIRAVMILIMLALVFTRFYPSQHEATVPQAKDYVENPHEAP